MCMVWQGAATRVSVGCRQCISRVFTARACVMEGARRGAWGERVRRFVRWFGAQAVRQQRNDRSEQVHVVKGAEAHASMGCRRYANKVFAARACMMKGVRGGA